uniref:Retrovirus-related Pol polyprotein from transposon TNT 1-94 n=1 Tax=Tanacetum cinerariifolium TaxID=118510 RepID=A0A6L2J399_TANCI|nr:retrovirus-related Pol polyprotein from transposon TNT 1-94 [Tanacetum cinerariifolium]
MTPSTIATITTSSEAPIPPPTIPSIILKNLLTFNSAFRFEERLRSLETSFFEYRQTNPFADAVSAIPGIVQQFMTQQMTEAVREAVQIQTDRLQDSLQRENDEFLRNIDENMKKIIKGQVKNQVKEQVSRILPRIEESMNATLEAEVLTAPRVLFVAGEGGECSGRRGIMVELGWNGGEWWGNVLAGNSVLSEQWVCLNVGNPKTFQPKNKGLLAETFDWDEKEVFDEEEVSNEEEVTQVKILKAKAKPVSPCTHCGFNDHRPRDCRNYHECGICGSYDHFTLGHNHVIKIRGGVLAKSSQSNESSINVKCDTCESTVHSTTDHNKFDHFKKDEKIQANFTSPYTPKQNGVAKRKNRKLIEAAKTMLNGLVLSKQFWTKAVRISRYTLNRSIIVKRHDKTPYVIFKERISDINYFHVFRCLMFIHNHKDHLGKFDAKADDGYFLGYSFVLKYFKVFNTRRQQVEETYHVTFDESIEAISSLLKTPMVPPNNLGLDLAGKRVNDTSYKGMIGSLMYLTVTRPEKAPLVPVKYLVEIWCCASILWMKSQLNDYDIHYKMVPIFYDNMCAISISNNLVLHLRTKHIDIRYHFIRVHILKRDIELQFIPTEYQLADIFTNLGMVKSPKIDRENRNPNWLGQVRGWVSGFGYRFG